MEAVAKIRLGQQPPHFSLRHHRPSLSGPISSLSFRTPPPPRPSPSSSSSSSSSLSLKSSVSIRASSSSSSYSSLYLSSPSLSDPLLPNPKPPKPQFTETLNLFPLSVLKTAFVAVVAATAIFFARFNHKPLVAGAISPPPAVETASKEAVSDEEKERALEEHVSSHPDDVQALRNLMEVKVKNRKVDEAIGIIQQLIKLEPEDLEWQLMKDHMHLYNGDLEIAKSGFNEILEKDPFRVEAYHGLVMAASEEDSGQELKEVEKRAVKAMEMCKREKKKDDLRDFKLLLAQIKVIGGNYNEALKIYQELVKEEPRDFRPYLCQGIIYTLLKKTDEAEKQFQKYRRLVPKGHPYAQYFDDNMIVTKLFAQKVENERAAVKS